jgi:hypothetical protein
VTNESLAWEFAEFVDFMLESGCHRFGNAGARRKQPDHNVLVGALAHGAAEKGGVALVEHIDDAVVIDELTAFAEVLTTGGAYGDLIRDRLAARRTELHSVDSPSDRMDDEKMMRQRFY